MKLFPFLPVCLKAWTLTRLPCVRSAAACVVIGWHQTSFFPCSMGQGQCQSHWQSPPCRHGQRLCQTAPQAQPLFDCPTSVSIHSTGAKLEVQVCAYVCVCVWIGIFLARPTRRPTHYLLQTWYSGFQHLYIQCILYIPARWWTKSCMVVMSEIKHAED